MSVDECISRAVVAILCLAIGYVLGLIAGILIESFKVYWKAND